MTLVILIIFVSVMYLVILKAAFDYGYNVGYNDGANNLAAEIRRRLESRKSD